MTRILYAFLLGLFASTALLGQTGEIQGKVIDDDGEGIPFANVSVLKDDVLVTGTATDFDGKYSIPALTPGTYDVEASYQGNTRRLSGVIVSQGIAFVSDLTVSSSIKLDEVVIEYEAPLVDRGNTRAGGVVTKEDIKNIPTRNVNSLAATKAGVYQSDEGAGINIKGSRGDATEYIIDGIRVSGSINLPQNAIEQLEVITGGVDARYGDATGGFITITTRGPSKDYNGEVELITSEFLDNFGYNLGNVFLTGPILRQYKGTDSMRSKLGFFIAAEYVHQRDPDPAAIQNYVINPELAADLLETPLQPSATGSSFDVRSELVTLNELDEVDYKQNTNSDGINITGKLDYRLGEFTNLTFGGTWRYFTNREFIRTFSLFNSDNNPYNLQNTYRGYLRFTQRFPERKTEGSSSVLGNAYYSIQADYTKFTTRREDPNHGQNAFNYGYVGSFDRFTRPIYALGSDEATGLGVNGDAVNVLLAPFSDTLVTFAPGDLNPGLTNYTNLFYDLNGSTTSPFLVQAGGGLLNGDFTQNLTVYNLYYNQGVPWFNYSYRDDDQYSLTFNAALDLKNNNSRASSKHSLEFGFEFQQRVERFWGVNPIGLWTIMRQLQNQHIDLDLDNPILTIDGQDYTFEQWQNGETPFFGSTDTVNYPLLSTGISTFASNVRQQLGLGELDYVNIDALDPSFFSLGMFSADELLNNGNQLVFYNGYTYDGAKQDGQVSWSDFFTKTDENGNFTREVDAFRPIYSAAYIQDRFNFNDIVFRVGVRVDRYDANRKVLKDDFSLYDRRSASEVEGDLYEATYGTGVTTAPSSIGDEFAVYVDDLSNPSQILGYRDDRTWYNAEGEIITNPDVIAFQSNGGEPNPYLVNPTDNIKSEDYDPNSSFEDYEPQVTVMPRVAFSFPISKEEGREALFFAHYDVLAQRPQSRANATPYDYYFIEDNQGPLIDNPNLRPQRTIDYNLGFQQQITDNSVVKLSAFYRELRDNIQIVQVPFAYPIQYTTYGNIDFGTVKGLTFQYEIARRIANIKLDASYTLQFADGTGSNSTSQINLVGAGQPNLRTIIPLSYDSRHTLRANVDYRYGSGDNYDGPRIGDSDIFSNMGANLQLNMRSGEPYSRQSTPTPDAQFGVQGRSNLDGDINGSRLPWHFRADFRVDKTFSVDVGNNGRRLNFNVYIWVQNLFNNQNILSVYPFTGNPDDDGYLSSAVGQEVVNAQVDPESFTDLYTIKVANPNNFSLPRRTRLGISMGF
jgi:hypothetical protein